MRRSLQACGVAPLMRQPVSARPGGDSARRGASPFSPAKLMPPASAGLMCAGGDGGSAGQCEIAVGCGAHRHGHIAPVGMQRRTNGRRRCHQPGFVAAGDSWRTRRSPPAWANRARNNRKTASARDFHGAEAYVHGGGGGGGAGGAGGGRGGGGARAGGPPGGRGGGGGGGAPPADARTTASRVIACEVTSQSWQGAEIGVSVCAGRGVAGVSQTKVGPFRIRLPGHPIGQRRWR